MTRIRLGWRLAKDSWAVLRADRSLAIFPILAFVSATIAFFILIAPGVAFAAATDKADWIVIPFLIVAAYGATFATIYFNVALAGAAARSLEGHDTTLQDGLAVARQRRAQIARWALVQTAFGVLIQVIHAVLGDSPVGRLVASILGAILGAAWAIATFFIVPVLALEGLEPRDALKRSVALIRERWGEGFVGSASIGLAVFLVALLPLAALVGLAELGIQSAPALGAAASVLFMLALIAVGVAGSALGVIFRVALYRYATQGQTVSGFADADLAGAFAPGKRR
ncbi:MAG: hypothetical protein QOD53_1284 [Thermoleophilaceae bacterium]|jgi:hypothetical protein|nr:hypothetical protein [Thermoleophilaceae bacterium]